MDNRRRMLLSGGKKKLTLHELMESATFSGHSSNYYNGQYKTGNFYYFGHSLPYYTDDYSWADSYVGSYIVHVAPLQIIKHLKGETNYGKIQYSTSSGKLYFKDSYSNIETTDTFIGFTSPYSDDEIFELLGKAVMSYKRVYQTSSSGVKVDLSTVCNDNQVLYISAGSNSIFLIYKKDGVYKKICEFKVGYNTYTATINGNTLTLKGPMGASGSNDPYFFLTTIGCD